MNTFREMFEKFGGKCPVCGNSNFKNMVVGSKKIVRHLDQILFFCLDCGNELSGESKKACFSIINNISIDEIGDKKYRCKIIIEDLGSFLKTEDPRERETRSVCKVLTTWNIPMIGPPAATGNE